MISAYTALIFTFNHYLVGASALISLVFTSLIYLIFYRNKMTAAVGRRLALVLVAVFCAGLVLEWVMFQQVPLRVEIVKVSSYASPE